MRFSVIVVCLNPGDKLNETLGSILKQTCRDYEIIVKDGGSKDGSIENMPKDGRIRLFAEKDTGIYDAMNQAVSYAKGEFLIFMNCGDRFPDARVLERIEEAIRKAMAGSAPKEAERFLLYGNTYSEKNDVVISSSPRITGFTCYRNIPCHQSCVYAAALCKNKPYDLQYKIRADYDHFLWCYYTAKARMIAMDVTVASYEGGGFSEDRQNRQRDKQEHKQITETYMSRGELFRYRLIMLCTLAPLRRFLAENQLFSGWYHWLKESIYHRNKVSKT